ncbi:hypothetical protein FHS79_002780 [Polymorphobacter multimanifer]|uniref:Uncharacterized protein n=1 Tax=Polymorphobacter multimanifer TaxID=1070431 RepID=A0A841L823_9SPHN|nr:hypothetical protein [Polymorphobacter multimanifer]
MLVTPSNVSSVERTAALGRQITLNDAPKRPQPVGPAPSGNPGGTPLEGDEDQLNTVSTSAPLDHCLRASLQEPWFRQAPPAPGPVERTSSADPTPKQHRHGQSTGEKATMHRLCNPARRSAQSPRPKLAQRLRPVSGAGALKHEVATGTATWRTGQTGQGSVPTLPDRTRTGQNGHRKTSPASHLNGRAFPERPAFLSRGMAAMQPS